MRRGLKVADARTFTEAEHVALLTDAVTRETAKLTTEKADAIAAKAAAEQSNDVLESEKAAAITSRDAAIAELATFKADIDQKAEIAARVDERVAAVKAANETLAESFFTPERAARWASMDDVTFAAFVADIGATKPETAGKKPETAAFTGGETPTGIPAESGLKALLAHQRGAKA
jgi:hypothetical protein